jgi:hypothetical protein
MFIERFYSSGKIAGQPLIIGIQEGEEFTTCFRNAAISGRARPRIRLRKKPNPGIGIARDVCCATIGRSIVNHDHFELFERLFRNRV